MTSQPTPLPLPTPPTHGEPHRPEDGFARVLQSLNLLIEDDDTAASALLGLAPNLLEGRVLHLLQDDLVHEASMKEGRLHATQNGEQPLVRLSPDAKSWKLLADRTGLAVIRPGELTLHPEVVV